ncbi:MAG: LLM class flavin-dependent oxidoreductase [Chloroflexota bacterium]
MRFGIFGGPSRTEGNTDSDAYNEFIEMVMEAEDAGFFGVYLVEHHFTGRGQLSASLNLLSHLAARTKTIRLGAAVVVVPWHNPLMLAEQAGMIDVLSKGRLDLGLGRGYRDYEFKGFGIDIDSAQARFEEAVTVLRRAWQDTERFSFDGQFWHFDDVQVDPRPVQTPHPPLWIGAGSPESIGRAAREGFKLYLDQVGSIDVSIERVGWYREAREAMGAPYSKHDAILTRSLRMARSEADREGLVERQMDALRVLAESTAPPSQGGRNLFYSPPEARRETVEGASIIGTPDECIARLKRLEAGGVEQVAFIGLTPDDLRFFTKEILPAFK